MPPLSKLQIRAKLLSVISEIKLMKQPEEDVFERFCGELDEIDDKKSLFDIFIKEYIKLDETAGNLSSLVILQTVPAEYIIKKSEDMLKSANLSDECRYKIVQLLRLTGADYSYDKISEYFDNPKNITDYETKNLLDTAVYNPDAMLDFLDFVSAVSERDKSLLLESLAMDYSGNELAHIVYPILYSDFSSDFILQTVKMLSESKSPLAIAPFEYLIEINKNEEITSACQAGLKKLKLAGASKEKALEYFNKITQNTAGADFYVTIPDGTDRQAVLIIIKHKDGVKYSLCAAVISNNSGVMDCFGFYNINENEASRVLVKFYNSEGHYSVPAGYVQSVLAEAEKLNIKNKISFPYEYICWKPLISSSEFMEQSLKDYADKNCKKQNITKNDAMDLLAQIYTLRWFITPDDSALMRRIIDKIYKTEDILIQEINYILKDNQPRIFDEKTSHVWRRRFYHLIYILRQNKKEYEADCFYTILNDESLFELFKQIIMQRSIFSSFSAMKENACSNLKEKNIFRLRNSNESRYDIKKITLILDTLTEGWLNG